MQVSFRKILVGVVIAASFAAPAMAEVKIGVVDYARLFDESPQAKALKEALNAEFGPRVQKLVADEQALKARGDKFQKDSATMTADQKAKSEKDLRDGLRDLERRKGELQDDSNAKRQEEMNKLQRTLIGEVREYAKAQNFDIVIADGVIYHTATVDITPAVLNALNSRAPKPAAAPAANPAPAKPPAKP
ncbi:MAG TPA: OmpH family outer membrane protein [Steroidobacteraceae bacterium]|nr:OmpH family outer membrane protein [Steroidobacteraceae bacterium]